MAQVRIPIKKCRSNSKLSDGLHDSPAIQQMMKSVALEQIEVREPVKKSSARLEYLNKLGETANNSDSSLKSSNDCEYLNKVHQQEVQTNQLK